MEAIGGTEYKMKKKILFLTPPVILAVITLIWLFYEDGRWYSYNQEWQWGPLFVMHLLFPLFYFVVFIVRIIRHVNKDKRTSSDVFYIASSIAMSVVSFIGLLLFLIFTSGA
ncbi:MAG: hypothetical protein K6G22_07695 [Lachnospiraceae bacterium]|nr:hypothetical protein [Lachnospiraceae bacterium]